MPAPSRLSRSLRAGLAVMLIGGTVAACAPQQTGATYSSAALGRAASVSYGTIVGMRPVQVQGNSSGVGTAAGAVAGGVAGSFIGGDWRSNALAGLGGAVLGGLAGNAIGRGVSDGQAVEFFVREDQGGDISVVQTNEEGLGVNDRVVIARGDRTRLSRAAGGPPPGAYAPPPASYGTVPYGTPPAHGASYGGPKY
ncbi:outer membrane lipoprotein [Teichococcus aestuarii]|uniref:glycine zipper 2TM domain-containing protein n=1 Tax=Teichococcus aestuarii TaxID=568898 RepID=UPI001FEB4C78|nr:glycine zipper 2TM domain-containing protein [Pseudoroseomonas aestuarii]